MAGQAIDGRIEIGNAVLMLHVARVLADLGAAAIEAVVEVHAVDVLLTGLEGQRTGVGGALAAGAGVAVLALRSKPSIAAARDAMSTGFLT